MKKRKKQNFPLLFLVAGGLLLIVAAVVLNSQNGTSQPTSQAPVSAGQEEIFPEIERVSLEEAKAAFDTGAAVFVDVRSAEAYAASHVAGSVSLPLGETASRLGELDPNQWIVTYCT